jgi:Na+/melibiose symporter-like transporter
MSGTAPNPADVRHNERVKLTATWMNTIAAGTIVAGFIAPLAIAYYGGTSPSWQRILSALGVSLLVGGGLHWAAWGLLGRLRP